MNPKQVSLPFNIADVLLCLLLIFADSWARANFPAQLYFESGYESEHFTSQGFVAILIGGVTGMICFFYHPAGSDVEAVSWVGKFSRVIEGIGTFIMAGVVSVMAGLVLVIVAVLVTPEEGDGTLMVILFFVLFAMIAPFILTIRYYKAKRKIRFMHPTVRYIMLLPAIFLVTAMMNANAIGIFQEEDFTTASGFVSGTSRQAFNFLLLYVGPRMFATGQPIEWKNSANWAIGCALYFGGLSLGG